MKLQAKLLMTSIALSVSSFSFSQCGCSLKKMCGTVTVDMGPPLAAVEPTYFMSVKEGIKERSYQLLSDNSPILKQLKHNSYVCVKGTVKEVKELDYVSITVKEIEKNPKRPNIHTLR